MSDVSGIEISDVLGLSDPITKLIETISGGIGKLYEPTNIRRMAKARAAEIRLLGEAISDVDYLPVKYNTENIVVDGMNYSELAKRAQARLAYQELKKQSNIDHVVCYAAKELDSKKSVSPEPIDADWITRFFDSVADVSTDKMQQIWGKILAGEVNNPGKFSLRTIEPVRNMSQKDAELFVKIAPFLVSSDSGMLISSDSELLLKYGLSYGDIMVLDECGLINSSGTLNLNLQLTKDHSEVIYNPERMGLLNSESDEGVKVSFGVYALTRVGKELYSIVDIRPNNDYIVDLFKQIESRNRGNISISIHIIDSVINDQITYQTAPIEVLKSERQGN